jgi:hypothetical protein
MKVLGFDAYDGVNTNGTSLQGHIMTTYDKLCDVFGEPTFTEANPRESVNCEWTVEAECQDDDRRFYKQFTVYCWKYGRIPLEECEWNIGGDDFEAWSIASDIIGE